MIRENLLRREQEAWSELDAAIKAAPSDRLEVEGVVPGWSIHDLLWHCAYWASYAGELLERLQRGEPEPQLDGGDVSETEILTMGRGMAWDEVIRRLKEHRERARRAFSAIDDPPDVAVGLFTEDTFAHYGEHAAEIRAFCA